MPSHRNDTPTQPGGSPPRLLQASGPFNEAMYMTDMEAVQVSLRFSWQFITRGSPIRSRMPQESIGGGCGRCICSRWFVDFGGCSLCGCPVTIVVFVSVTSAMSVRLVPDGPIVIHSPRSPGDFLLSKGIKPSGSQM